MNCVAHLFLLKQKICRDTNNETLLKLDEAIFHWWFLCFYVHFILFFCVSWQKKSIIMKYYCIVYTCNFLYFFYSHMNKMNIINLMPVSKPTIFVVTCNLNRHFSVVFVSNNCFWWKWIQAQIEFETLIQNLLMLEESVIVLMLYRLCVFFYNINYRERVQCSLFGRRQLRAPILDRQLMLKLWSF